MLQRLALLLLWASTWLGTAQAASFDPRLEWRTLETPHFNITFHQGEAALAEEVAGIAEAVFEKMSAEFDYTLKRPTELLIDPTDLANGYATASRQHHRDLCDCADESSVLSSTRIGTTRS